MTPAKVRSRVRAGRAVTVGHLRELETSQETHYLYCRRCHGSYSADPRDYFYRSDGSELKCCGIHNLLLTR